MKRKILIGFLLIGLQSFLVGGLTAAYFVDSKPLDSSKFQFSTVQISVAQLESVDDSSITIADNETTRQAGWTITNTGSQDVRLRVKVTGTLTADTTVGIEPEEPAGPNTDDGGTKSIQQAAEPIEENDGKVEKAAKPDEKEAVTPGVELIPDNGWELKDDGYYYYDGQLEPDGEVPFNLTLNIVGDWSGQYTLQIEAQALQVPNTGPVWPELD